MLKQNAKKHKKKKKKKQGGNDNIKKETGKNILS